MTIVTSIVIPLAIIIAALYLEHRTGWFAFRRRKELSYEIVAVTPLVSVDKETEKQFRQAGQSRVKVFFDGQPVEDVKSLIVKVSNTGNIPVTRDDYEKPIRFVFYASIGGELTRILEAKVIGTEPQELAAEVDISHGVDSSRVLTPPSRSAMASISPALLNPGDSVTLSFLLQEYKEMKVQGRIVGVREIREIVPSNNDPIVAIANIVLPVTAFALVSTAIGAYLGSLIDSQIGSGNIFATVGLLLGFFTGLTLWRRGNEAREPPPAQ